MIEFLDSVETSRLNTALLVAALGFLWHQSRTVDQLRQALFGVNGKGGALEEIVTLREGITALTTTLATLETTIRLLKGE